MKALAKHDVDFDKDPNARAIFQTWRGSTLDV